MSMSGAFEAMTRAAVVPRPPRPSGVRASVSANSVWVTLSTNCYITDMPWRFRSPDLIRSFCLPDLIRSGLLVLIVLVPAPASACGAAAHRYIMGRAIDLLPADIKPFFEHYRDELVLR